MTTRRATATASSDERTATETRGVAPGLTGVSETMLWSLHHRASEARRGDGVIVDPDCMRIAAAIDYDYARHFGDPLGSLAARAAEIDRALLAWLAHHPEGTVVSLGEGLETQARRVDNGRMRWLSVDLPDAIRLRERFLPPTHRFRHVAASALDPIWMEAVDPSHGVCIVAQGLLMYLPPDRVHRLVAAIADRFPGADLLFDAIPRWFSELTVLGLNQTASYRLPPMPWGINRDEIEPTLRRWHACVASVAFLPYGSPRGLVRLFAGMTDHIPILRHGVPSLVHVKIAAAAVASTASRARRGAETIGVVTPELCDHETRLGFERSGDQHMPTTSGDITTGDAMGGLLAAVARNVRCGSEIVAATTNVIGKRVALGATACLDPLGADRAEFSRMVPEKIEAFSSAGMVVLKQSGYAGRHMLRMASDEIMTTARATIEMTGCAHPAALMEAQGRFARAWLARATSSWLCMGLRVFEAQSAAMAPIRQVVVANSERLGR